MLTSWANVTPNLLFHSLHTAANNTRVSMPILEDVAQKFLRRYPLS